MSQQALFNREALIIGIEPEPVALVVEKPRSAPMRIEVGTRPTPLRVTGRRNVTLRNFAVMRNRGAVH